MSKMFSKTLILSVGYLALFNSVHSQNQQSNCCYDNEGNCLACYVTQTLAPAQAPPGAFADTLSNGNVPNGSVTLGNVAQAGQSQNQGFFANAVTQNNATGAGAYIVSSASSSATNSQTPSPNVVADSYAGSSGSATQGSVNNLDQSSSNGNGTSAVGNGQSQVNGTGTGLDTFSGASASAQQRSMQKTNLDKSKNPAANTEHGNAVVRSPNQRVLKMVKTSHVNKPAVAAAAPKRKLTLIRSNVPNGNAGPSQRRAVHKSVTHQ